MAETESRPAGTLRTGIDGEESLAEARRLIGVDHRGARTSIEITEDNVRDYCGYIDCDNPLFLQPERGRRSRWGRALAPPTMIGTAIIAPGLKGVQWIYGGARWTFHKAFGPGDLIAQSGTLTGADLKTGRNAAQMIVQKGLTRCVNQRGELVAETEVVCMRIPRRRGKGGLSYAKREVRWTRGELDALEERMERQAQNIRGAEIRYWDDLQVGEPLPETVFGPLRLSDIALTRGSIVWGVVGGREHNGGYGYMLDHYRRHPADSYVNPETGATEHPHRGHWEQYMAEEVGMPGIYDVGYQRLGWLCRAVTDWAGDDGRVRMIEGMLRKPTIVGDVTTVTGTVSGKHMRGDTAVVSLALVGRNQTGEETVVGSAEVELLARHVPRSTEQGERP